MADTTTAASDDAALVAATLRGERSAFATLYDRYADRLYDHARRLTGNDADAADCVQESFVLALQRLPQLRDPALVRPWLYAIVRSEVHRRHRRMNRIQFGWFDDPQHQPEATDDTAAAGTDGAFQAELRALLDAAADGLGASDREVLDLHLRHGLDDREVGAALGLPERQVSVTLQRFRDRLGRSIGAVLAASSPCEELASVRGDGTITPLQRKRVARHIDGCPACTAHRDERMRPAALLSVAPIALAPAALRGTVMDAWAAPPAGSIGAHAIREGSRVWREHTGFPEIVNSARRLVVVGLSAAAATVGTLVVLQQSSPPPSAKAVATDPATTPESLSETTIDTRVDATSTTASPAAPSTASTLPVSTLPVSSQPVSTPARPAPTSTSPPVTPTAAPTTVADTASPVIGDASVSAPKLSSAHPDGGGTCIDTITAAVTVAISDDRGVAIVTMRTSIEGGQVRETTMSASGSNWSATIGPYAAADIPVGPTFGIDTTIIARDAAGNETTRSFPRLGKIDGCPIS